MALKRVLLFATLGILLTLPLQGHPHEWVDWGVGLVLDEKKPVKVVSALLELTWDEWFSSLVLMDFPGVATNKLGAADLSQLDTVYGLASSQRQISLLVWYQGQSVKVKPVMQAPRTNGKTVTLVYSLSLGLKVDRPGALRVSVYDPSYYTDMGIRAKSGAFFRGVKDPAVYSGSTSFEQDFNHPYYGGAVFPEVVVFSLKP